MSDVIDREQVSEEAPAPEPAPVPEVPPIAATILVTFAPGTLEMGITSTGLVGPSHLWAASALLERIATQLWTDGQMAARQKAMQDRSLISKVALDLSQQRKT